MARKGRREDAWQDAEEHDLPRSAHARSHGRGDRPGREVRKKPKERDDRLVLRGGTPSAPAFDPATVFLLPFEEPLAPQTAKLCGRCRNWLDLGQIGGRGECDHPGSGILFPYNDTPACPFWERR